MSNNNFKFKKYETDATLRKLKWAFYFHRTTAFDRGIDFLLTYEEWIKTWIDSGHIANRGKGAEKYCMARFGDQGPYAIGNVKIITCAENSREGNLGRVALRETKQKMSISQTGKKHSESTLEKMSRSAKKRPSNRIGTKHTEETKQKMRKPKIRRIKGNV